MKGELDLVATEMELQTEPLLLDSGLETENRPAPRLRPKRLLRSAQVFVIAALLFVSVFRSGVVRDLYSSFLSAAGVAENKGLSSLSVLHTPSGVRKEILPQHDNGANSASESLESEGTQPALPPVEVPSKDKLADCSNASISEVPSAGRLLKYDAWGLPPLEQFENTLPPKLREGKEAIAAWAAQFYASSPISYYAKIYQRILARAISNGTVNSLTDMTIELRDTVPLNCKGCTEALPQSVRVIRVAGVHGASLVMHVEDVMSKRVYSLHVPVTAKELVKEFGDEGFLQNMEEAVALEKLSSMQACGNISAEHAASHKGIVVPLCSGRIDGLKNLFSGKWAYIYNDVKLTEKIHGSLLHLRTADVDVMAQARDYIAFRLLHIILRLEQSGVGHIGVEWGSFFLQEDGSFLLGNFDSASPFGKPVATFSSSLADYPEPKLVLQSNTIGLAPEAQSNLWSLGVLLFELYTGETEPYGRVEGSTFGERAWHLSKNLLSEGTRSRLLIPKLEAHKVPFRWKMLILQLLEPNNSERTTALEIIRNFPDLVYMIFD
ncbi:hypothetical protein, conserved [Eimeria necatrix]|uniref:Protein kinase domain-containing protein n=1 Tax=Eimeria necatrix TaxID=51315 RepID=U6MJ18_9EIME|nr:hypothetical protein, conserved [Eimeria necatrix]CDJ63048.1 hypothetical protein, conserved [Eimeria necatrix]